MKHVYETIIREKHLDVFGHVNNAQYMVLFEEARWEMITSRGYGLAQIMEYRIGTVVLESTIRYRREIKNREPLQILTWVREGEDLTRKIVVLEQCILKADGEVAALAEFKVGCFDLESRKLVHPTKRWISAVSGQI